MKLRIFAAPSWFRTGTQLCPLLAPWAAEFTGSSGTSQDVYARTGREYFIRTGPAECDQLVCPTTWRDERDNDLVERLSREAKTWGKPLVVFCESDIEAPFPVPGVLAFRGSLRSSARLPGEFPVPAFISDYMQGLPATPAREPLAKTERPIVGFCGKIDTTAGARFRIQHLLSRAISWGLLSRPRLERGLRRCGLRLTRSEGKRARYQALGVVLRCPRIQSNILLRDHFQNGTLRLPEAKQAAHRQSSLQEFCDNVLSSHYTLCPRGGGNWSFRFYETLCLGRVPVFINTDCVLPYESLIHWRDYCVWVEGDAIEQTAEAILRHYYSHSPESFAQLQHRCRELWVKFLSLDGFFRNFHRHAALQPENLEACAR